jgi:hypothetical protein
VHGNFNTSFEIPHGFVTANNDGSIWIRDDAGWFRLGARPARYARIDVSPDGTFVIAVTTSGEVLVWDLRAIRPSVLQIQRGELPAVITRHSLWTVVGSVGVHRHDLATGATSLMLDSTDPDVPFLTTPDEAWVATLDYPRHEIRILESGKPVMVETDVESFGSGDGAVVFGKSDGEVVRWRPGGREVIARLGEPVLALASSGGIAMAVVGRADVVHITLGSGAQQRATLAAEVSRFVIDTQQIGWILTADGHGFRWDPDAAAPVALEASEPFDDIQRSDDGVVFHGARAMVLYEGATRRVVPASSRRMSSMGDHLVAVVSPQGTASVVDLGTGASIPLPLDHNNTYPLVTGDGKVGLSYWLMGNGEYLLGMLQISVPRTPAELQQWLRDITNAKPVPGSEAVAWP